MWVYLSLLTLQLNQVAHEDLQATLNSLETEVSTLRADNQKKQALNERLESDLLRVNQGGFAGPPPPAEDKADAGTSTPGGSGLAGLDLGGKKAVSELVRSRQARADALIQDASKVAPVTHQPTNDTSILPIVTSQRDRFRQRNAELEEVGCFYSLSRVNAL